MALTLMIIDEVRKLLDDPPDEDQLQEIDNMIDLPPIPCLILLQFGPG